MKKIIRRIIAGLPWLIVTMQILICCLSISWSLAYASPVVGILAAIALILCVAYLIGY